MRFDVDCRPQIRIVYFSVQSVRPLDRDQLRAVASWLSVLVCVWVSYHTIFLSSVN